MGLYLANAGSSYGAVGSLVVFLLWVFYSAQILFMGAEFTQVYARRYGSGIRPDKGAVMSDKKDTSDGKTDGKADGKQDKQSSREPDLAARRRTTTP